MENKQKAVAYLRAATGTKISASESVAMQKRHIFKAAERQSIEIARWFEALGQEPQETLNEIIAYCKADPEIKYLIVAYPDRLARSARTYLYWRVAFEELGVDVRSADNLSATAANSPMNNFMELLMMAAQELDHEQRTEAIRNGLQRKKSLEQPMKK